MSLEKKNFLDRIRNKKPEENIYAGFKDLPDRGNAIIAAKMIEREERMKAKEKKQDSEQR